MRLRDLDLNLLLIFHQIVIDKSVSGAADSLGLSQPAVSNALKRLRVTFNDALFVRTSQGMQPTPYAALLISPIAQTIDLLNTAINQRDSFDPKTSKKCFYVSMTDIGDMYFLPRLIETLMKSYPNISVKTQRSDPDLAMNLEEGQVDLAVGLHPELQAGFHQRRLFHHRYVALCRVGHPLSQLPMTRENFCRYGHIKITSPSAGYGEMDVMMRQAGLERDIRLEIPHFLAVAPILRGTDLIATVPERFAMSCLEPFQLISLPLPLDLPEIAIHLFWHSKYHRDPANQWFRQLIFDLFAD